MKTAGIFAEVFTERTTGRRAMYTVNALTVDAVKVVLNGVQLAIGTDGAEDDERGGYVRRDNKTGYYGGTDGYKPTAKGCRAILKELENNEKGDETMNEQAIKNIEWKLNDLAKAHETYTGSVFADTGKAYAQGIAFALAEIGYSVEWENGTAHVVKIK